MGNQVSPSDWVEEIRKFDERNPCEIFNKSKKFLFKDLTEEIILLQTTTKKYTIRRSLDTLYHDDDDPGLGCLFLTEEKSSAEPLAARSPTVLGAKPLVFISLGWIVENNVNDTDGDTHLRYSQQRRTTNYVLLWNISTNPGSLWMVYDYRTLSAYGDGYFDNTLEDYHNVQFAKDKAEKGYMPALDYYTEPSYNSPRMQISWTLGETRDSMLCISGDESAGSQTRSGDFSMNSNGQSMSVNHKVREAPIELGSLRNGLDGIDTQALGVISSEKGSESDSSNSSEDTERSSVSPNTMERMISSTAAMTGCDSHKGTSNDKIQDRHSSVNVLGVTQSSIARTATNFLGCPEKFDLAMIAPSIHDWDPKKGLAADVLYSSLNANHHQVGDKLRAASVPEKKYKESTKQRVVIKHCSK